MGLGVANDFSTLKYLRFEEPPRHGGLVFLGFSGYFFTEAGLLLLKFRYRGPICAKAGFDSIFYSSDYDLGGSFFFFSYILVGIIRLADLISGKSFYDF